MVDDTARDRAIYHALKAADEVAAALQTHLIEEHGADPERAAPQSPSSNSLKLLRQARELGIHSRHELITAAARGGILPAKAWLKKGLAKEGLS